MQSISCKVLFRTCYTNLQRLASFAKHVRWHKWVQQTAHKTIYAFLSLPCKKQAKKVSSRLSFTLQLEILTNILKHVCGSIVDLIKIIISVGRFSTPFSPPLLFCHHPQLHPITKLSSHAYYLYIRNFLHLSWIKIHYLSQTDTYKPFNFKNYAIMHSNHNAHIKQLWWVAVLCQLRFFVRKNRPFQKSISLSVHLSKSVSKTDNIFVHCLMLLFIFLSLIIDHILK